MTTTAEKIESLARAIKDLREDADRLDSELQAIAFAAETETPDPEPLECWVTVRISDGYVCGAFGTDPTDLGVADDHNVVKVREVTPQDEQDRKDAARYRKHKELVKALDRHLFLSSNVDKWDRELDKAMGEE